MLTTLAVLGIAWYVYGIVAYFISYGVSTDARRRGDKLFPGIIFAGVWVFPVKVYFKINYWLYVRRCEYASEWIAEQLRMERMCGVENKGYNPHMDRCFVDAEPQEFQFNPYRHVYARAVRKFRRISPTTLCASANHVELLDWYWAQNHGFREYAGVRTSLPCDDCGNTDISGVKWGMKSTHAHLAPIIKDFLLKDGTLRSVANYLCLACRERLCPTEDPDKKWVRATLLPLPDLLGLYRDPPFTMDDKSLK